MKGAAIAIDHGTQRTGFASTDPLRIATRPLETWHGPGDAPELLELIATLVNEHLADTVIVGMPFNMDGSRGPQARVVEEFLSRVRELLPAVRVIARDERLTTRAAEDLLRYEGLHGRQRKSRRDSWSALVLLRDWIDSGEPAE